MTLQIVRFRTDAAHAAEIEEAARELFTALEAAAPQGMEYTALRVADGEVLLMLDLPEGAENPLLSIPEAAAFRERISTWAGRPVPPEPASVLGRYSA